MKLKRNFYLNPDVVQVAKDLLGKYLCTNVDGRLTSGIITETEAYAGVIDKASHAYAGKRTNRTETMFAKGGTAYVYLCYGIHHLFNVVTNSAGEPHAVLIRAIKPVDGIPVILERRAKEKVDKSTAGGPGTVSQALGILTKHSGTDLLGDKIWIEDRGIKVKEKQIKKGPRVGVDYAGKDAKLPYRFIIDATQY